MLQVALFLLSNPFSPPNYSHGVSDRAASAFARMFVVCIVMGAIAGMGVCVGDRFEWPHFNRWAGYLGTEFIGGFLYAINDSYANHIVAVVWFLYGSVASGTIVFAYRLLK
ncbi:hypothetical protein OAF83_03560 [Rubripirellula sp.]|jgi:hypothetical protein|nr:hypothetical protein [Rubripirellula sp.]MDB4749962.1 hypothetical protein [Rubripirellula sp.]